MSSKVDTGNVSEEVNFNNIFNMRKTKELYLSPSQKIKRSNTHFKNDIHEEVEDTNIRRDNRGNAIKKGGRHRVCFRDKLPGKKQKLVDVVNVAFLDKIVSSKNMIQVSQLNNGEQTPKPEPVVLKSISVKSGGKDDNCSCSCNIF